MEITFKQECSDCKYYAHGWCFHPYSIYCEHSEYWTPNCYSKLDDSLIITYDCCSPPDAPTLCIARKEGDKVEILNTIQGDVAFGMYHYLTGNAELKDKEIITNADNIRSMNDKELAEFLMSKWFADEVCKNCEGEYYECGDYEYCTKEILKWLSKEKK